MVCGVTLFVLFVVFVWRSLVFFFVLRVVCCFGIWRSLVVVCCLLLGVCSLMQCSAGSRLLLIDT